MTQALFNKEDLARKPAHGQPCNNCGLCCRAVLCEIAQHVFCGDHRTTKTSPGGPCPALEYGDDGTRCGLVADPQKYIKGLSKADAIVRSSAAKHILRIGMGCTARFNGEPADKSFLQILSFQNLTKTMYRALQAWGMLSDDKRALK